MQTNILWTGREYYSLENCVVNIISDAAKIESTIVGKYGEDLYTLHYHIITNTAWETRSVVLDHQINAATSRLHLEKHSDGSWQLNGKPDVQFNDCIDVDIPLTPFTNTLPINRLKMNEGEEQIIKVIYLDLLSDEIKPVRQKYRKLSATEYHYENIPNDFEATITVDNDGFVVDYPELFVRTVKKMHQRTTSPI